MYRVNVTGLLHNFEGLNLDFQTVDAGAWAYFITTRQQPLFTVERIVFTTGSARYVLSMKDQPEIAAIELRAMGSAYTQTMLLLADRIHRMRPPAARSDFEGAMMRILQSFRSWLQADIQQFQEQAKQSQKDDAALRNFLAGKQGPGIFNSPEELLAHLDKAPKARGRPPTEVGQWVRAQFNAGRDISDILEEFMAMVGLQGKDPNDIRTARDRLRRIRERNSGRNSV
jgi:hypothetical protein